MLALESCRERWPRTSRPHSTLLQTALAAAVLFPVSTAAATVNVFDPFFRYREDEQKAFFQQLSNETIDPFTGTLSIVHEDFFLPGRAGLDLHIVRAYSSKIWSRTDSPETSLAETENAPLGYGWTLHMGRLRNPNGSGQSGSCSGDFPVYEAPDGSARVFYPVTGSSSSFISRDYWRLDKNCSFVGGSGACIWSSEGRRYEFAYSSANQFFIETTPVWPVTAIVDPVGNRITMAYVQDSSGYISSVTDTYSRVITFGYRKYTDGKKLDSITANAKTYSFAYTRYAMPAGTRSFLTQVTPPAGPTYRYAYATTATVAQNQGALSMITVPDGGTISYSYDSVPFFTGRESIPIAVVVSRTVAGRGVTSGTWTYAYDSPGPGPASPMQTATITRPDGKQDGYTFFGFGYVASQNAPGSTWLVG